jgi:hypothetical protein
MDSVEETRRAAAAGVERAATGAADWTPVMEAVLRRVASEHEYFTMDDIRAALREVLDPPPFNLMAFGAVLLRAMRDGMIVNTYAERPSRTRSQHRHRTVYRSRIAGSVPAGR